MNIEKRRRDMAMKRIVFSVILLFGLSLYAVPSFAEKQYDSAKEFIEDFGKHAQEATQQHILERDRRAKLTKLLQESFDVSTMVNSILGPYRKRLKKEELFDEFVNAFTEYVVAVYVSRMEGMSIEHVEVFTGIKIANPGENVVDFAVDSDFSLTGRKDPITITWRVRHNITKKTFRIVDISFNNLSMLRAHSEDIRSALRRARTEDIINELRTRRAKIENEDSTNIPSK